MLLRETETATTTSRLEDAPAYTEQELAAAALARIFMRDVREAMKLRHITQTELGTLLGWKDARVSKTIHLRGIETCPSVVTLCKLANALDCDVRVSLVTRRRGR